MDIETIKNTHGVKSHSGCETSIFADLHSTHYIRLPSFHKNILRSSNGIEAYFGYFRLFGLSTSESVDSILWNQKDHWKFAWGDRCSIFWCFGETAWGDQYAYLVDELRSGRECVYYLDAFSMTGEKIADNFHEFIAKEFLRNATEPYDQMILKAYQQFGCLDSDLHLVYTPSLLLGGDEKLENVQKMNARAAMICNGDIALQLDNGPSTGQVISVSSCEDEKGRSRLKLVWG